MEKPMPNLDNTSKMLHLSLAKEQSFSRLQDNGFEFEYECFSNFDAWVFVQTFLQKILKIFSIILSDIINQKDKGNNLKSH